MVGETKTLFKLKFRLLQEFMVFATNPKDFIFK